MGFLVNDPWAMTHLVLGWQLMGTLGIFLLALLLQGVGRLVGARQNLRFRTLLISIVVFIFALTIIHVVNGRGMRIYWDDIVMSFFPVLTAPIIALMGSLVWPHKGGD